jgi:hypothetical protein
LHRYNQGDYDVVHKSMHLPGEGGAAGMQPEIRAKLDAFFAPQREALVAMFGDDRLRWTHVN